MHACQCNWCNTCVPAFFLTCVKQKKSPVARISVVSVDVRVETGRLFRLIFLCIHSTIYSAKFSRSAATRRCGRSCNAVADTWAAKKPCASSIGVLRFLTLSKAMDDWAYNASLPVCNNTSQNVCAQELLIPGDWQVSFTSLCIGNVA